MKIWEARDQSGDVSAGGLHFDGYRDGVPIVLDHKNDRKAGVGGGVERLPELAFTGGAIAQGNVGDLVPVEFDVFELPVIAGGLLGGMGMSRQIAADFGAADGVQNLGPGGRRAGNDIQVGGGSSAKASAARPSWDRRAEPTACSSMS